MQKQLNSFLNSFLPYFNSQILFGFFLGLSFSFVYKMASVWNRKLSFIINLSDHFLPLLFPQESITTITEKDLEKINYKRLKHSQLPIGQNVKIEKKWKIEIKSTNTFKNKYKNEEDEEENEDNDHKIPIYFYQPLNYQSNSPLIIWIHGGGFVVGNAEMYEPITTKIANETGCIVAVIDYCKAPENKFPKPIFDCLEGIKWLYDHVEEYNINKSKITVLGDSAGGNLTIIATCEFSNIIQLSIPIYPTISFGILNASKVRNYNSPMLKGQSMDWYNLQYFKHHKINILVH